MQPTATRNDFRNLPEDLQDKYERLLTFLRDENISCRCEMAGREFVIVIAPGLSAANYWLTRFGVTNSLTYR